jgi:geranylgeranyl reductase family protein
VHRVDVAVVGGGPAGAAAATTLARAGREVVLIDKAVFPRDKCCGDGLTTGALRELEMLGLDWRAVASWHAIDAAWVRSPSGRTVEFPFPRGRGLFAAIARRADLDLALLELARAAGAKVHEGHQLVNAAWSDDGVTLTVDGLQPLAARYVIGADGMWSPLRKALGLDNDGYLGEWHAFRQYLSDTGPLARRLWVWFEPDLLPGYAWSFPLPDGTANVGFGIHRRSDAPTRSMASTWRSLLARPHIAEVLGPGAVPEAAHKAWPIPARLSSTTVVGAGGRALFVGDAARATDPMTGEGIGQALETARLAASAVLRAGPSDPSHAARSYERGLATGMSIDHRLAATLSSALSHRKGVRGAVRIAGANEWTRRHFARWLFEDYPRAALATPWRWHRGLLSGSGSFRH